MGINFNTVYRVSSHGDGGSTPAFIAVGTRVRLVPRGGVLVPLYQFRVNSLFFEGKQFMGGKETHHGDVIEVEDLSATDRGVSRVYRFEPLTLSRWQEMADDIVGYSVLNEQITSDDELQDFYRADYLIDSWSAETGDTLEEAKAYPIGTIRPRGDGYDWQKMPNGDWVRVGPTFRVSPLDYDDEEEDDDDDTPPDLFDDVPEGEWKDVAEGVPRSTFREFYFDDDETLSHLPAEHRMRPKPERMPVLRNVMRRLRRELFRKIKPVAADRMPVAVLTMGVPASGKSTAVGHVVSGGDFVHVDPDRIKEFIPEYQIAKRQRARNAASIVHEESGYLAELIRDEAVRMRANLVFEGVGRDLEYYQDMVAWLRLNGYRIQLVMTHVEDAELAIQRSNERGAKLGRWVPEDKIRDAVPLVPKNFVALTDEVDDFAVFDTEAFPMRLAWAREEGEEVVPDEALKDRLIRGRGKDDGGERDESAPSRMPPAVAPGEVANRFLKAWELDHASVAMMKRRYQPNQGVLLPGVDPKMTVPKGPKS